MSGPLWKHFHKGTEKQNKAHWKAYCLGYLKSNKADIIESSDEPVIDSVKQSAPQSNSQVKSKKMT